MSTYGVLLFHNSSSAMQAEAVLLRAGLKVKLVPTPRHLSSDCGVALRFDWELNDEVGALLTKFRVDLAGTHLLDRY